MPQILERLSPGWRVCLFAICYVALGMASGLAVSVGLPLLFQFVSPSLHIHSMVQITAHHAVTAGLLYLFIRDPSQRGHALGWMLGLVVCSVVLSVAYLLAAPATSGTWLLPFLKSRTFLMAILTGAFLGAALEAGHRGITASALLGTFVLCSIVVAGFAARIGLHQPFWILQTAAYGALLGAVVESLQREEIGERVTCADAE